MTDERACGRIRELAPELALGVLSGHERAEAQAHLDRCPACRAHVRSLTQVSDRLLTLVPPAEPPVGFEDRVLARIGISHPPRRRPHRWLPLTMAAAIAAVVFGLGGWAIGSANSPVLPPGPSSVDAALHSVALMSGDDAVGRVFTYHGSPPWIYMSVTADLHQSSVTCQLVQRDGSVVPMGTFPLTAGQGSWGRRLPVDPTTVVTARLFGPNGALLASADLTGATSSGPTSYQGGHTH